ncbi:MAG: molybdopterin-guanine dinucleotide biosynthesis protein B [Candidatus Helarchaeota archaeon]
MNPRYFSIVGYSGSGKTYLIEKIIKYLKKKDYHVGIIKSMHHPGFGIDIKNKDTTRYGEAGADLIAYKAPESGGIVYRQINTQNKLLKLMEADVDFIIMEGFNDLKFVPQFALIKNLEDIDRFVTKSTIGIYSNTIDIKNHELYIDLEQVPALIEKFAYPNIPLLNCRKCGLSGCVEFYYKFLKGEIELKKCVINQVKNIKIYINNKLIPLNHFTSGLTKNIINGLVKSLTIPEETIKNVEIQINY